MTAEESLQETPESGKPTSFRIGDVVVDINRRQVRRGRSDIRVGKLSYRLLLALAEAAPKIVDRDELVARVWDGRYVSPATFKQRVALLRRALGDSADQPKYITAVRGQGYGLIPPVEPVYDDPKAPMRNPLMKVAAVGLVVLGTGFMVALSSFMPHRPHVIVVQPFENLSPEPENAYFATGLREELLDQLAQLEDLEVISGPRAERLTSTSGSPGQLVREPDVDTVMEGSVRYSQDRVRISVRLVDVSGGAQLWTQTYERDFADIFEIQRDVATSVAGALGVSLGVGGVNAFRGAGTNDIRAYEAYLKGLDSMNRAEGQARAIAFFRQATELDPDYAAAWAQIGFATLAGSWTAPPEDASEILERAYRPAVRAVELDPASARANSIIGTIRYATFDWIGGEESHARSIQLRTDAYTLAQHANLLIRAGRSTAALAEFEAAEDLDRSSSGPAPLRVQVSIALGRYAEARALAALETRAVLRDRLLLNIALNEGDTEAAKEAMMQMSATQRATAALYSSVLNSFDSRDAALAAIRAMHANQDVKWAAKSHDIALLAAYFGAPDLALESIAAEARLSTTRHWALWYPLMSGARQLPEFKVLVTGLNLVDYWRDYGWPDACMPIGREDFACR